jgi:hypothetical protein
MADLSNGPAGGLTGYMTMLGAMGENQDRTGRLAAFLQDQPYIRAQQAAQTQGQLGQNQAQQFQNINAPTMMQAKLYGTPFEQQEAAEKQHATLAQLGMTGATLGVHQGQLAETSRHNLADEANAATRYNPIFQANQKLIGKGLQIAPNPTTGAMDIVPLEGANANKPVPIPAQNNLTTGSDMLQKMVALRNDFKPDYAGYAIPGAGEAVNMAEYAPFLPTDQRDWWKNYEDLIQASKRHSMYGGGLTGREIGLSKSASINPAMQSDSVGKYMDARIGMMLTDMQKSTSQLSKSYNPQQIEAATGIPGIKDAKLSPKTMDDFAEVGKNYREMGHIGQIAHPTTKADFDKIPSGEKFVNPADGQVLTKK